MASVGGSPRGVPEQRQCRVSTKGAAGSTPPGRLNRTWGNRVSVIGSGRAGQSRAELSIPGTWDRRLGVKWGACLRITWGKTLEITFSLAQWKPVVVLSPADRFLGSMNKTPLLLQRTRFPCLSNVT